MSDSFPPEKPPDFPPGIIIPQPLIYPDISGQGIYTNVLLIDSQVIDYQKMVDSVNASTFPIVYSMYSQKTELLTLLQTHFTTIERIALAFISSLSESRYFLDNQPLFQENETQPYSENVQFILDLTSQFQVQHLDYLACDTLNYANWNTYYDLLKQNTTAVIGASSDKTGNIYAGGDWVLENTSEDIELIYFSTNIKYYQYLLDNATWATSAQGLNGPIGVVVDPTNTYLYVYNEGPVRVGRILISNPTSFTSSWVNVSSTISSLVIDSTNTYMYGLSNSLYRIPIANPSGWTIMKSNYTQFSATLVIDPTNTYIYHNNIYTNAIFRISTTDPSGDFNATWATLPYSGSVGLAIDPTNTYLYAAVGNGGTNGLGSITRISIANPETKVNIWASSTQANGPQRMMIDSQNKYLYVVTPGNRISQISIANPTTDFNTTWATSANGLFTPRQIAKDPTNTYMYVANYNNGPSNLGTISQISFPVEPPPCFLASTRILTDEGYVKIQYLRKGDLIQTLNHGLVPIDTIGYKQIYHPASKERIKDQLYKYSNDTHSEIFEDLVLTGCHSVLVDFFVDQEQRAKTFEVLGYLYMTDGKYRLPACADENAEVYETPGEYIIYHFALEHEDYYMNYGVFANGLLVETTSKRYMKELSQMTILP